MKGEGLVRAEGGVLKAQCNFSSEYDEYGSHFIGYFSKVRSHARFLLLSLILS